MIAFVVPHPGQAQANSPGVSRLSHFPAALKYSSGGSNRSEHPSQTNSIFPSTEEYNVCLCDYFQPVRPQSKEEEESSSPSTALMKLGPGRCPVSLPNTQSSLILSMIPSISHSLTEAADEAAAVFIDLSVDDHLIPIIHY